MSERMSLYDAGLMVDEALPLLDQALSAMMVTMEALELEDDGLQPEGKMNEALALNFMKRLPMYYKTLALIHRDMWDTLVSLQATVDSIFKAYGKQREEREAEVNAQ